MPIQKIQNVTTYIIDPSKESDENRSQQNAPKDLDKKSSQSGASPLKEMIKEKLKEDTLPSPDSFTRQILDTQKLILLLSKKPPPPRALPTAFRSLFRQKTATHTENKKNKRSL